MSPAPFADRLAGQVEARDSQVCLGLDPDPNRLRVQPDPDVAESRGVAVAVGEAVAAHCRELIGLAGEFCVAVKPQLACFERLGAPGWQALADTVAAARDAGLLVVADGKRGDVPVSSAAYAQSLIGFTATPLGPVAGLGADAATVNPLTGADSLEPLAEAAAATGAGLFVLVRTSNRGAADVFDLDVGGDGGGTVSDRIAALVNGFAEMLAGREAGTGLSGMGAVVGATEPGHIARLRELMPRSIFLLPGVGAQGGSADDLGPAFGPAGPAGALVTASRSIAGAEDPAGAAAGLRDQVRRIAG